MGQSWLHLVKPKRIDNHWPVPSDSQCLNTKKTMGDSPAFLSENAIGIADDQYKLHTRGVHD